MLDGPLLPANSSIRDFQKGKVGYVADAVKQALLRPKDMVDLRTMKKHEVFLSLKRDLAYGKPFKLSFLFLLYIYIYIYFFFFFLY